VTHRITPEKNSRVDSQHISVRRHAHDRNGVNTCVREERPQTTNQNDTWHVFVAKELKRVSAGAKCRDGKTWNNQLIDKVVPV